MKIRDLKPKSARPVETVTERRNDGLEARAEHLANAARATRADADSVDLSSASELGELGDVVERDRAHSLDEIKSAIREGRYAVDYQRLADALLSDPNVLTD